MYMEDGTIESDGSETDNGKKLIEKINRLKQSKQQL